MKPDITGGDLVIMGESPGPIFGETLRHVLAAKLDGTVVSKEEQLALAGRYLAERHEGATLAPLNLTEVLLGRT